MNRMLEQNSLKHFSSESISKEISSAIVFLEKKTNKNVKNINSD